MEKNFWKMSNFSIFWVGYAYVDCHPYLADALFIQEKIPLKFKGELTKSDFPYHVIFCKVRKKDVKKFESALKKTGR